MCFYFIYMSECGMWMMASLSSLTWPDSDWLDSGAWWGCTPVSHEAINVHRLNQPSPHTFNSTHGNMEHYVHDRFSTPLCLKEQRKSVERGMDFATMNYTFYFTIPK